jgi:hypothetical protein
MKLPLYRLGIIGCLGLTYTAHCVTNELSIGYQPTLKYIEIIEPKTTWRSIYEAKFNASATTTLFDRFGPFSTLGRIWERDTYGYGSIDRINSAGKNAFVKIFTYAARETALANISMETWGNVSRSLVVNSVGNTAELEVNPLSESYTAAQASWWRAAVRDRRLAYGVRLGTSPYGYFRVNIGHRGDAPLVVMETRVRYKLFGAERVEQSIFVPLPYGWRFHAGLSYMPSEPKSSETGPLITAFRLERPFGSSIFDGAFFIGGSADRRNPSFTLGFQVSW